MHRNNHFPSSNGYMLVHTAWHAAHLCHKGILVSLTQLVIRQHLPIPSLGGLNSHSMGLKTSQGRKPVFTPVLLLQLNCKIIRDYSLQSLSQQEERRNIEKSISLDLQMIVSCHVFSLVFILIPINICITTLISYHSSPLQAPQSIMLLVTSQNMMSLLLFFRVLSFFSFW